MARSDLEAGQVQPVLTEWSLPEFCVFAAYPHRRYLLPKVRVFLDTLAAAFGDGTRDPWWPDPGREAPAARPGRRPALRSRPGARRTSAA